MTTVAVGDIQINLHDEEAIAGLHKIDREVDRSLRNINGKEAELQITGNLRDLRRKLKEAEALEKEAEAKHKGHLDNVAALNKKYEAEASRGKKSAIKKQINQEKSLAAAAESNAKRIRELHAKELPAFRDRERYVTRHLEGLKRTNAEVAVAAQRARTLEGAEKRKSATIEAGLKRQAKANDDLNKSILSAVAAQDSLNAASRRAGVEHARALREDGVRTERAIKSERSLIKQRSEAEAMDRARTRSIITRAASEEAAVARLQRKYETLYIQKSRLEREGGRVRNQLSAPVMRRIGVDHRGVSTELAQVDAELKAWGAKPIEKHVSIETDSKHGSGGFLTRWANALTDATVRVGPFTTTIAGLTRAMALLGPVVTGVVGHVGALVAVLGSGLAGAAGVGAAAIGGFGLSLGGVGLLLPSLLRDFKHLSALQDTYHKRLLELGPDADKTVTALEKYKHALKSTTPTTRQAFKTIDALQSRWRGLRKEARPDFFAGLSAAVKTIDAQFGWFRTNTLDAFHQVSQGWQRWMAGLRGEEASSILSTLGSNANASIKPLMSALGHLLTAFGRVGAAFSDLLPGLLRGFDTWAAHLASGAADTDRLDAAAQRTVGSMRSLGHFTMALGRFLIALFAPGVDTGRKSLDGMTAGLDRATVAMRGAQREKIAEFFKNAADTSSRFFRAIAPFAQMFFEWTTIMRPFTNVVLGALGALGKLLNTLLGFGPTKAILIGAFGIFLYGGLSKKIVEAATGLRAVAAQVMAIKAAGGLGGALKGGLIKFVTGGAVRGATPANPLFVTQVGGGLPGRGAPVAPGGKPGGGTLSRIPGVARIPAGAIGGIAGLTAAMVTYGVVMNKIASQRNAEKNSKQLQSLISERNIGGIRRLQAEYEKFGKTPPPRYQKAIDEIKRLNAQDTNRLATNIKRNWDALLSKTHVTFTGMSRFAERGMQIIHNSVRGHSESSEKAARQNFRSAAAAIKQAIRDGKVSTEKGMAQIHKLWVETLKEYGFSAKQARNIGAGNSISGGKENNGTGQGAARGGLFTVGGNAARGRSARDNVPAMLNGRPAVVAKGEQVAVFNRHQQKEMDQTVPGGLSGFFSRNKKPHYMAGGGVVGGYAGGGIVPVPGFPGERAASSVIGMIETIAHRFHVILTDAFGPGHGHKSPGHNVTGTAADFSGPDTSMDAAVKFLTGKGYLVGYDGRFGSQDWPGHGPSTRTPNYHFHVELGGGGGGGGAGGNGALSAPEIERQMIASGLGNVSIAGQAALDTARGAAQANLDAVTSSLSTPASGGEGGVGGGAAMGDGQLRSIIAAALHHTNHYSAANVAAMFRRVMQESGGNPKAINLWDSNAKAGHPSKGLGQTIDSTFQRYRDPSLSNDIYDPLANLVASIRYMIATYGRIVDANGKGYAKGGIVPGASLVGEGRGPEILADKNSGAMRIVKQPTIMRLKDSESVIPTDGSGRGRDLMKDFASSMGIPGFAKGKPGKKRGSKDKKPREAKENFWPEKLPQIKKYRALEDREDAQNAAIDIADRTIREPDDLVIKIGTDEAGNDLFGPNTPEIDRYRGELNALVAAQSALYGGPKSILSQLAGQFGPAMAALQRFRSHHEANKAALEAMIARDRKLSNEKVLKGHNKGELTKRAKNARARLSRNENRRDAEIKALGEETTTRTDISDDHKDLSRRRIPGARLDLRDQKYTVDALSGRITDAVTSANPTADGGGAGGTQDEGLSYGGQASLTDTLLAGISKEFGSNANFAGSAPTGNAVVTGSLGSPGMPGAQANPASLLGAGFSGINERRGADMSGMLTGGSGGVAASSDAVGAATASASGGNAGAAQVASVAVPASTQKVVNITNNFQTQPADPLTWTKGVEFEAGAAI